LFQISAGFHVTCETLQVCVLHCHFVINVTSARLRQPEAGLVVDWISSSYSMMLSVSWW